MDKINELSLSLPVPQWIQQQQISDISGTY